MGAIHWEIKLCFLTDLFYSQSILKKIVLRVSLSRMMRKWSCRCNTRRNGKRKMGLGAGTRAGLHMPQQEGEEQSAT